MRFRLDRAVKCVQKGDQLLLFFESQGDWLKFIMAQEGGGGVEGAEEVVIEDIF